jgi:hypothetical protein
MSVDISALSEAYGSGGTVAWSQDGMIQNDHITDSGTVVPLSAVVWIREPKFDTTAVVEPAREVTLYQDKVVTDILLTGLGLVEAPFFEASCVGSIILQGSMDPDWHHLGNVDLGSPIVIRNDRTGAHVVSMTSRFLQLARVSSPAGNFPTSDYAMSFAVDLCFAVETAHPVKMPLYGSPFGYWFSQTEPRMHGHLAADLEGMSADTPSRYVPASTYDANLVIPINIGLSGRKS